MPDPDTANTALVLGGGGARAAYQIGVLDAIRQVLRSSQPATRACPFNILSGTSAGAINVAYLAGKVDDFDLAVRDLVSVWSAFTPGAVYRTDVPGALTNAAHWISCLAMGWLVREAPRSMFDNRPLHEMLQLKIDFASIDSAIAQGRLGALAINTSSYTSGQHVTFYQSRHHIRPWSRTQRGASRTTIAAEHLMASSAIPFVFPAIRLQIDQHVEYFGDGAMRQSAPISPAIHLGADRIVVIGAGQVQENGNAEQLEISRSQTDYPSLGQIGGHVMASIFLDGMSSDVERLERINRTLEMLTPEQQEHIGLRPLNLLSITPSQRLDTLAKPFISNLPRTTRSALRVLGATGSRGVGLASYLLFDKDYTAALIALGYADGMARSEDIATFFAYEHEMQASNGSASVP